MEVMTSTSRSNDTSKGQLVGVLVLRAHYRQHVLCLLAGAGALLAVRLLSLALLKREFKMPANNAASSERRDLLGRAVVSAIWTLVAFTLASAMTAVQTTNAVRGLSAHGWSVCSALDPALNVR